jgi:hypothetical protein
VQAAAAVTAAAPTYAQFGLVRVCMCVCSTQGAAYAAQKDTVIHKWGTVLPSICSQDNSYCALLPKCLILVYVFSCDANRSTSSDRLVANTHAQNAAAREGGRHDYALN